MKAFTDLYLRLDQSTRTGAKVQALVDYFRTAPPRDAAWAVYVLSGRRIGRAVSSRLLREWAAEASGYPGWLLDESYHVVGDLSETISLLVPVSPLVAEPPLLHEIIEQRIKPLAGVTRESQRQLILATWAQLETEQRFVFHKLLGGEFRVGVSGQLLIRALAEVASVEPALMAHRLAGNWKPDDQTMSRLLGSADGGATDPGMPYPFMLAHPLHKPLASIGPIADWLVEWKWDGIRAQLIRRAGRTTLWSRGDEVVTATFPEITQAGSSLPDGTVLDGEIVAWDEAGGRPMPFIKLQRRLNRKSFEITFWPETPVTFVAFDALEIEGHDVRSRGLRERRELLATVVKSVHPTTALRLSEPKARETWDAISAVIKDSRRLGVEGVMLKRWDSPYTPGRTTGLWWKLKVEPYTADVVMIAAEPGHGKRAGLLTDYTFGVWDGPALVPIAKAYSGLTDPEVAEIDRFARRHTVARHGPVHEVEALLVFEIGFEAIQASGRHKSGIALRFPRILRIRKDKKPPEADQLETMRELLEKMEARQ